MEYVKPTTPKKAGTRFGVKMSKLKPERKITTRTTKRPNVKPVPLPSATSNIAPGTRRPVKPKPAGKITKKPSKPVTERQLLDVRNMTPAEKAAYLRRGKSGM